MNSHESVFSLLIRPEDGTVQFLRNTSTFEETTRCPVTATGIWTPKSYNGKAVLGKVQIVAAALTPCQRPSVFNNTGNARMT